MPNVNERTRAYEEPAGAAGLVRAAKAAALGDLTRGLAHELNNPLFAILGLVDFLVADAEPGSRAHRRLTVVRETALEMRELLRAVLDFAREPAGVLGRVDLGETVRQTVELARRSSASEDVDLEVHVPADALTVLASRNEVRQALLHLLANAFAALPGGGTLTVGLDVDGRWARVSVADSGPGVPADLRDRIFEPFFTTRADGSGLGLAACRAIAESHGGTLELAAGEGGATFVLRLPLADETDGA
ncbi:MAG: ATP-binding protein [Actinomycetota bacterium]|nr:ATP-binding protein [Actinomycetota bacterium]